MNQPDFNLLETIPTSMPFDENKPSNPPQQFNNPFQNVTDVKQIYGAKLYASNGKNYDTVLYKNMLYPLELFHKNVIEQLFSMVYSNKIVPEPVQMSNPVLSESSKKEQIVENNANSTITLSFSSFKFLFYIGITAVFLNPYSYNYIKKIPGLDNDLYALTVCFILIGLFCIMFHGMLK